MIVFNAYSLLINLFKLFNHKIKISSHYSLPQRTFIRDFLITPQNLISFLSTYMFIF